MVLKGWSYNCQVFFSSLIIHEQYGGPQVDFLEGNERTIWQLPGCFLVTLMQGTSWWSIGCLFTMVTRERFGTRQVVFLWWSWDGQSNDHQIVISKWSWDGLYGSRHVIIKGRPFIWELMWQPPNCLISHLLEIDH